MAKGNFVESKSLILYPKFLANLSRSNHYYQFLVYPSINSLFMCEEYTYISSPRFLNMIACYVCSSASRFLQFNTISRKFSLINTKQFCFILFHCCIVFHSMDTPGLTQPAPYQSAFVWLLLLLQCIFASLSSCANTVVSPYP